MTDKDFIYRQGLRDVLRSLPTAKDRIAWLLGDAVEHDGERSLKTRDKRFVFDDAGELVKVQEMVKGQWRAVSGEGR